ncbi:DNA-binding protein BIN4 [Dendrobium catenatum]|uniref:DNA-binding protein BIN4 n=1 Tax=Dendrobium catenatum TaxID=906689 RepID=A0A2I0VKH8_9ASPA|nr:DNA-binding protein BIN4 [Dendrobium catenatum]
MTPHSMRGIVLAVSSLVMTLDHLALVECDGESIDLSGDVGAVGRIIVSKGSSGNNELFLDLKGIGYKASKSMTFPICFT